MSNITREELVEQFEYDIDDWWCALWSLQIGATPPKGHGKRFISYVSFRCVDAGDWKYDDDLPQLFADFYEEIGEW
tara:strand:- start:748 stop:975 length:228 start_codon:yes stop_codon:yes gene_type:complete